MAHPIKCLERISLQWRILSLATVIVAFVSLLGLTAVIQERMHAWQEQFRDAERGVSLALTPLLRNSLIVGDLATVQETLDVVAHQGKLRRIALLKPSDRTVILEALVADAESDAVPEWFASMVGSRPLQEETRIAVGGVDYGILFLEASDAGLTRRLWDSTLQFVAFGLMSLLGIAVLLGLALRKGLAPLQTLVFHASRLGSGHWQEHIPPIPVPEIAQVAEAFNQMADRIRERESDLVLAKEKAEAAGRAKANFLAAMSHEIRTPMNGILGMTELALACDPNEEVQSYLEVVRSSGETLMAVLNDILDYSKIDAGRLSLEFKAYDPVAAVHETSRLFSARCVEKRLNLKVDVTPDVPPRVMGDGLRLRQVLSNLLSNAVKFTEQGDVTIELAVVPKEGLHRRLLFRILDSGIGVAADKLESIFDPFVQVDDFHTRRYGGTGLGLAISRRIVGLMGGDLSVHSEPGQGSCFYFAIPLELPAGEDRLAQARVGEPSGVGVCLGKRVLVAEDALPNQILIRELLRREACDLEIVEDGEAAIQAWQTAELADKPFDLILMDMQMPNVSGLDATRVIRSKEAHMGLAPVPIVALTANVFDDDREECLRAGMNDFLGKPFKAADLTALLRRHLHPQLEQDLSQG